MAKTKVWAPPTELNKPSYSGNWEEYDKAMTAYEDRIKDWCKKNSKTPNNELVGVEVSTPVGDGYARYLVLNIKPLELIHIDSGDAWNASEIWLKGLDLDDVKLMAKRALNPIFGSSR
jgi:hypothetical protein